MVVTLRPGRRTVERGGLGVTRHLTHMRSEDDVFWSEGHNSFVVVQEDTSYRLLSVNGIGEIRWNVEDWNRDAESNAARAYFFRGGDQMKRLEMDLLIVGALCILASLVYSYC